MSDKRIQRIAELWLSAAQSASNRERSVARRREGSDRGELVVVAALIALCLTVWRDVVESRVLGRVWLRKLILAREFVEGYWVDVASGPATEPGHPGDRYVGIVTLTPSGSELLYTGRTSRLMARCSGVSTLELSI